MLCYIPPQSWHLAYLAPRLRRADRNEIAAASGASPLVALAASARASTVAMVVVVGRRPAAVFGVVPLSLASGDGTPWMLGTDVMVRHARALLAEAPAWIGVLGQGFRRLSNHVDARNTAHLRWLARMGFTIGQPVPFGPFALPFHPCVLEV